ncbi:hypothetical protein BDF19DRAFT_290094 [Syncephalis fuscata]|nr:hypothetical protein BDF19DRAFT_290094 [Syncephalis fuscata]
MLTNKIQLRSWTMNLILLLPLLLPASTSTSTSTFSTFKQSTDKNQAQTSQHSFSVFPLSLPINAKWEPSIYHHSVTAVYGKFTKKKANISLRTKPKTKAANQESRLSNRLRQHQAEKELASTIKSSAEGSKSIRLPTEAQQAFTTLNQACELLRHVSSSDLQTRMIDTIYSELREQYANQPLLFGRLVSQLMCACDRLNRVDLAESVFARHHKHAGDILLQHKAVEAYTQMVLILYRRRRLDQAETVFQVVEAAGAILSMKVFNMAIVANARSNRQAIAFSYLQRMIAAGYQPRSAPINALIAAQQPLESGYEVRVQQLLKMLDQLAGPFDAHWLMPLHLLLYYGKQLHLKRWSFIGKRFYNAPTKNPAIQRLFLKACIRVSMANK